MTETEHEGVVALGVEIDKASLRVTAMKMAIEGGPYESMADLYQAAEEIYRFLTTGSFKEVTE